MTIPLLAQLSPRIRRPKCLILWLTKLCSSPAHKQKVLGSSLIDISLNGQQTLAENVADVAGISVSYDVYRASLAGKMAPAQDGLSEDQQFFIAFGRNYASKTREVAFRQQVTTGSHSPAEYRAS